MPELLCQLGTYMLVFELIVAEILGRKERKSNLEGYGKFHLWHLGRKKFGIKHAGELCTQLGEELEELKSMIFCLF